MALQTRINGFSAWINARLHAFNCQINNVLTELFIGTNMKILLESFTGKPLKRLQDFDGLTLQQILTRVEWLVAEMKSHDVIAESAIIDCQSVALRKTDHVLDLLWKLIEHDIQFTWERACQLQHTDTEVVCSVPFKWTPDVRPAERKQPIPGSALSLMASLESLEKLTTTGSEPGMCVDAQPSDLKDFQPFPGRELSKSYNKKIPKGGWDCYPSPEKCTLGLINGLLKLSCKNLKLKVKHVYSLMDSRVICGLVNAFQPKTFPVEVMLNDRWAINVALKTLEALLHISTSFSSDDLLAADPQAVCAYMCFVCMAGYKYKQSRSVIDCMHKMTLQTQVIASRLKTLSPENLDSDQFAEKNDLRQKLIKAENELSWFQKSYDVKFCEEWVKHGRKVQKNTKKMLLRKVKERFALVPVPRSLTIMDLCSSMGINLSLTPGSGFYQASSKEALPPDRRIIFQDRKSEEFFEDFSGPLSNVNIRKFLHLPAENIEIDPKAYEKFKVFFESKSKNQLLSENSLFLYQVFPSNNSQWHQQLINAVKDTDYSTVDNLVHFFKDASPDIINLKEPTMGNGALHLACQTGCFSIVQLLLENGASLDQWNERRQTPFYFAAAGQHRAICQLLIEWGCDLHAKYFQSRRALDVKMSKELKDYFFEYKAFWTNAVHLVLQGKTEVLKKTVQDHVTGHEVMASLRSRCFDGSTLLHTAAYYGETDVIEALLKLQVPVDLLDYKGATALQRSRDSSTMQVLLNHGADINWTDDDDNTALHMVCHGQPGQASFLDCLQLLLDGNASRAKWNKKELLPVHCAAMQGRTDIIQALLHFDEQSQAQIIAKTEKRNTPSLPYISFANSQLKCAEWLISHAFLFKPGEKEELMFNILLDEITVKDKAQSLDFLVNKGVNINAQSDNGNSALHYSVLQTDSYDLLEILLDFGAEVDIENNERHTPLSYAVVSSNLHAARLLIDRGANVSHRDNDSLTAFDYIQDFDEWLESGLFSTSVTQLLQEYDLQQSCSFVRG